MDLGDHVDNQDEAKLEDIIASIQPNEKLILSMSRMDAHKADELVRILEEHDFIVQPKGDHDDDYYLHCWKKSQ